MNLGCVDFSISPQQDLNFWRVLFITKMDGSSLKQTITRKQYNVKLLQHGERSYCRYYQVDRIL